MRIRVLALLALGCFPCFAALDQYQGKTVASIQFDPPTQPLTRDQTLALLSLKEGEPLEAADLRASIQRLYATGEYADIEVDASLMQGKVVLKLITKPNYFVGQVQVKGVNEPPTEGQLLVTTKLQLGSGYSDQDVRQALESLNDVVRRDGFYSATVTPRTSYRKSIQQADIDFNIAPGDRARFDGVTVSGDAGRPLKDIIKSTGWKGYFRFLGWRPVTESRVQSGVENVRSWYQKHNHLLAKVTLIRLEYHPTTNTVTPALAIESGPTISVNLVGAKMSSGKLRSILPIYQERSIDRDLLEEGSRDLVQYFQAQGYFDAITSYEENVESQGNQSIEYRIDKGIRHKVAKVEIEGNHYFDAAALRERMFILPASFLRYRHGRYSPDFLARDVNAIRDLYRANGFRDAEVTSEVTDNFGGVKIDLAVIIRIKEGPQWFVSKLDLQGIPPGDRDYLLGILHSTEGQPYSDYNVASDRDNVLDYYYNEGYPGAKFDFTAEPDSATHRVALEFVATPGERRYVREVIVSGLERTSTDLVTSRISLKPGGPLSQSQITESQRRLYDLGIFSRVDSAIQNPDGDEPTKYVLYSVEEARRYTINVGFGAEIARIGGSVTSLDAPAGATGFSPRVSFGVNRLNFFGLGHTVSMQSLVSTLEQRALVSYIVPQFEGNPKLNLQFTGLFDNSNDVRTFTSVREEGSVQLGQKLSKANTIQYRLAFRHVTVSNLKITPELVPLLAQPVRVGLFGTTFIVDRRDDPVDPHRGTYNTIDVSIAAKTLGSQTGFGRVLERNATYYQVTKNLVFARSTLFGEMQRFNGPVDIPLAEEFFSGGSNSHRGFPDNQAGPRDPTTGFPLGGNALLINTFEFRFPLIGDNLGGVLFSDIGNVYSDIGHLSLRFRQQNLQDFNYAVQAYGFGLRYKTPVGPVRVDLSLSPNSPRFFGFKGTEDQLLFGGGQQVVQRINVFQFHISLGQAF
jgi:outer membrane protein assembly complex protein YaeT